jgi:hypothetical protein
MLESIDSIVQQKTGTPITWPLVNETANPSGDRRSNRNAFSSVTDEQRRDMQLHKSSSGGGKKPP